MWPVETHEWTILDIGHSISKQTPLEQQAYRAGLAQVPTAFLAGDAYRYIRAAGVLWVESRTSHATDARIRQQLWEDLAYLSALGVEYAARTGELRTVLSGLQTGTVRG